MSPSELKPGQVVLLKTDFRARDSIAVAFLLRSPWTHVAIAVGDGKVLNTYPGTDAVILPAETLLEGREYVVLDLPETEEPNEMWRLEVARQAWSLVGFRYWMSPCSRLTALAFLRAGVPFFRGKPSGVENVGWISPEDFLTKTRLRPVFQSFN